MARDPVDTVRAVIGTVNDRTLQDRAAELIAPAFVRHDLAQVFSDSIGRSGATDFVGMIVTAMPDFHLEVEDVFGVGDRVTALLRMTGTHTGGPLLGEPANGGRLSANAIFVYRVADDQVAEAWQMVDGVAIRRVVGLG